MINFLKFFIFILIFPEEERVFFEIQQLSIKDFAWIFQINPLFFLLHVKFYKFEIEREFFYLERVSKRSRILDFFRGRSRASERTDNNLKDRDHSQVTLVNKTSMK
jgi:hypothetical protein